MLILSTNHYGLLDNKVAVIYHPRMVDFESKVNSYRKSLVKAQFVKAGESILTAGRWNYFDSVVVYPYTDNQIDYLNRLAIYKDAFKLLMNSGKTKLIFINSTINLLADKVLNIANNQHVFINEKIRSTGIDIETKGLNLINTWYNGCNFSNNSDQYKVLQYLSNSRNIKMLGLESTIKYSDSIIEGSLSELANGKLNRLTSEEYKSQFKETKHDE